MKQVGTLPKRVGYVLKRYPRYSETFVVNEILAHEATGLEIHIFSLRPPEDGHFQDIIGEVQAPVNYLPHDNIKAMDFWQALQAAGDLLPGLLTKLEVARGEDHHDVYQALLLARMVRLKGIEHLHAHFASSATTVARLAAHFAGVPYTFTAHAKDIYHENVDVADQRRKIRDAAAVITISDYNLNHLHNLFGSGASCINRIYNGLDLTRFSYSRPDNRKRQIVSVGRLVEKKGFHVLVDACGILAGRGQHFHCFIIGTGPLESDLRAQIERNRLHEKVELIGALPRHEAMCHIRDAAVLAAPSIVGQDGNRDGLPTTLLEAMALGTPCVSTDLTGIPEVLRDGETGLMVPQRDPVALADALERILLDPSLGVSMAEKARSLIESKFDIHDNAAQVREIFAQAALSRGIAIARDG